jgi:crotonobetaine/carnitine-CoA ligase
VSWTAGEHLTLDRVVDERAHRSADDVCVYFQDDPVTYAQMSERSTSVANRLLDLGIRHGDTVALLCENNPGMIYVWFGTARIGAIEVAINTAYVGEFLRHQLDNCAAKVVVVDAHLAHRVLGLTDVLPAIETVVIHGPVPHGTELASARPGVAIVDFNTLLEGDPNHLTVPRAPRWDEPCSVIYTGGTTGPSKGVLLSHNYMVLGTQQFARVWGGGPGDVMYSPLPLFHLNAKAVTVLGAMIGDFTGVLDRRFSVTATWDRVRKYEATGIMILGSMITMLWNLPKSDDDAMLPIRSLFCVPVPAELHRPIEKRYGCRIVGIYGLSEAAPLTQTSPENPPLPGSAGRRNPLFDVRIFDDNEAELPVGEIGEVVCRPLAPHVMFEGYYRNPEATAATTKNLWFHTGDFGRFDAEGNFFFVDRKKDAMRRRGENVSSVEVERAIMVREEIAEVAAHAVPSEFTEDDIKVCVVLKPGAMLTAEELLHHCETNMPSFAVPRYFEFLDELPKSPVGRVLKRDLHTKGVTAKTWDSQANIPVTAVPVET